MRLETLKRLRLANYSVRLMVKFLEERGHDVKEALDSVGLTTALLNRPGAEVTGLQELSIQRCFHRLTADQPWLWVELGSHYRLLSHAPEYYYLMIVTSRTLQEAIETGLEFSDLHYTLGRGVGIYSGDRLVGVRSYFTEAPQDLRRFTVLRDLGMVATVFRELLGELFVVDRLELPISADDHAVVERLLPGVPVAYDKDYSAWHWSARLDQRAAPQADPVLHEHYRRRCEAAVSAARTAGDAEDILDKLHTLLVSANGQMSLSDAAVRAGLSTRTLQRRLDDRGVRFREMVAQARYHVACRLLSETTAPIARIALDVGYDNIPSFSHAFRRQAGMSPRRYRDAATTVKLTELRA